MEFADQWTKFQQSRSNDVLGEPTLQLQLRLKLGHIQLQQLQLLLLHSERPDHLLHGEDSLGPKRYNGAPHFAATWSARYAGAV